MTNTGNESAGDAGFAILDAMAVLRVAGDDAEPFLQGQLSNDIGALAAEGDAVKAQLSSLNGPKGRVLAVLLVVRVGGDYLLVLPAELAESVRARLNLYVLRAKVSIVIDSGVSLIGVSGRDLLASVAPQLPEALWTAAPLDPSALRTAVAAANAPASMEAASPGTAVAVRYPGDVATPRALLILPGGAGLSLPDAAGMNAWRRLDVRTGVPVVLTDTQERFVAQMLNLDLLDGISFSKGCYTGQEVIARTQHLGRVKRRLGRYRFQGPAPAPGEELTTADGEATTAAVVVLAVAADGDAAASEAPGGELLAVVQSTHADAHLIGAGGATRLTPLPLARPASD